MCPDSACFFRHRWGTENGGTVRACLCFHWPRKQSTFRLLRWPEYQIIRSLTSACPGAIGIPYVDNLDEAELRSILAGIYRWMYWHEGEGRWDLDKDVSGADTVQMLCELMPGEVDQRILRPHDA